MAARETFISNVTKMVKVPSIKALQSLNPLMKMDYFDLVCNENKKMQDFLREKM